MGESIINPWMRAHAPHLLKYYGSYRKIRAASRKLDDGSYQLPNPLPDELQEAIFNDPTCFPEFYNVRSKSPEYRAAWKARHAELSLIEKIVRWFKNDPDQRDKPSAPDATSPGGRVP